VHDDGCLKKRRKIAVSGKLNILAECIVEIKGSLICLSFALNLESLMCGITEDSLNDSLYLGLDLRQGPHKCEIVVSTTAALVDVLFRAGVGNILCFWCQVEMLQGC